MSHGLPRALHRGLHLAAIALLVATGSSGLTAKTVAPPVVTPAPPAFGNIRYYFNVDLDSRYQIVGTGALTEEAAAHANCYRLTYDTNGRIERVEYRRAGFPTQDPHFQVARIDFEYEQGIERRWFRNEHGEPVLGVDGTSGEELALNPAGYPVKVTNLNAAGHNVRDSNWVVSYVRTLDSSNRLISARRTRLLGIDITDNSGDFETRTTYDSQGRVMERGNYDGSGNALNDNEGVAFTRTTYILYPDSVAAVESYFDASGLPVAEKSTGIHQLQSTHDNRGFLISEAYFDVTGAPTLDTERQIHEHRFLYNDLGERTEEDFYDVDGRLKDAQDPDGSTFARLTYQYDNRNRVITKSYFGDDGSPQVLQSINAAIIRQEYDNQGNISRREFFDGQGNPSIHARYGAPSIRIKVAGDTTTVTLHDIHDELMQNFVTGYAGFSFKTATDKPLSPTNHYFDRKGRTISRLRVFIINPHLHALRANLVMAVSARGGAAASGLGALLAMIIALRKASFTRRQKVHVQRPWERFVGWLAIFLIGEGVIRFFITIWWAYVNHQDGHMGHTVYVIEAIYCLFFLYRLWRMKYTMRALNISRGDIHGILREFFSQEKVTPRWDEKSQTFKTDHLDVRARYFPKKSHAYLSLHYRDRAGAELAKRLTLFLRAESGTLESFPRTRAIALYYPSVALCYALLAVTAFYTLWQVVKKY